MFLPFCARRKGKYQVFWLGWNADYPDAENFMFLLYSKAGKTKYDGENTSNYDSPVYDKLFEQMRRWTMARSNKSSSTTWCE